MQLINNPSAGEMSYRPSVLGDCARVHHAAAGVATVYSCHSSINAVVAAILFMWSSVRL